MKISILLVTYNQEPYVRQAVGSILHQRIVDNYEIIVADDCSNDGTFEVIREEFESSGQSFRVLSRNSNLGFKDNYRRAFAECKGEYIAVLEGDDYWNDNCRLIKHIQFLDNQPQCVLSFNRYEVLNESTGSLTLSEWNNELNYEYITTNMLALGNRIGNLSACVFRRAAISKLPPDIFNLGAADWLLGMALGEIGVMVKLKEPMSVYRVHSNGLWSGRNYEDQMRRLLKYTIPRYDKFLGYRYHYEFEQHKEKIKSRIYKRISLKQRLLSITPPLFRRILKLILPDFATKALISLLNLLK